MGQAKAIVNGYLETLHYTLDRDADNDEWKGLALKNRPFVRQGMLYLSARHLFLHHARIVNPKMIQTELLDLLRLLGGRRLTLAIREPEKTSRSLWRIPIDTLADPVAASDTAKTVNELEL